MFYIIYQITNLINGKIYVGKHQTSDLDDDYMGSGRLLLAAYEKYGLENFRKDILFILPSISEMDAKEKEIVDESFVSRSDTYNLCPGGHGGFGYINTNRLNVYENHGKLSGKTTAQIKKYKREKDPSYNARILEQIRQVGPVGLSKIKEKYPNGVWMGKKHTVETLAKFRGHSRQIGEKNSQFGKLWVTNGVENKKIQQNELDMYISMGYNQGRTIL